MCILGDGWRTTVEGERMTTSFQAARIKRGKKERREESQGLCEGKEEGKMRRMTG
jgi:hypothetical protein